MKFEISEKGVGSVVGTLHAGAQKARDTRVVMDRIVLDMLRVEKQIFAAQGRRGGGSWASLKEDTIKRRGGSTEILRTDNVKAGYAKYGPDALYRSLTEMGAPFQILDVTRNSIAFGTDRPMAEVQQFGNSRSPARPFLRFLPTDERRWMDMIDEHLMEPFIRTSEA